MDDSKSYFLNRRDFLRGAAVAAGAAAFGLAVPRSAWADEPATPPTTPPATCLAFWTGEAFVDPRTLLYVDEPLFVRGARVVIGAYHLPKGATAQLHFIDGHYAFNQENVLTTQQYYAWNAGGAGTHKVSFNMPVDVAGGITLSAEVYSQPGQAEYYFLTATGLAGAPVLVPGDYVLAAGSPDWSSYALINGQVVHTVTGAAANFEYVTIDIAHG